MTEGFGVLLELIEGLRQLRAGSVQIALAEMMHPDRGLDQTLIEKPKRTPALPPQVLPCFVSIEEPPGVEKNYSVVQKIGHRALPLSY